MVFTLHAWLTTVHVVVRVQPGVEVGSIVLDSIRSNVLLVCRGITLTDSPFCLSTPLTDKLLCVLDADWTARCHSLLSFIAVPLPCQKQCRQPCCHGARQGEQEHAGARPSRSCDCGSQDIVKLNIHGETVHQQTIYYKVFSLFLCVHAK